LAGVLTALVVAAEVAPAAAQAPVAAREVDGGAAPSEDDAATVRRELAALRAQVAALDAQLRRQRTAHAELQSTVDADVQELDGRMVELSEKASGQDSSVEFVLAGTATGNVAMSSADRPGYSAALSPHFLWSLYQRALFEAHLDVQAGDGTTGLNVEFAQLWVPIGDHLAVGAGKIIAPFGFYMDGIHTAWINRLPDEPLPVADDIGVAPTHLYGAQLRGAHRLGGARLSGTIYGGSAPVLELAGEENEHGAGALDHDRAGRGSAGGRVAVRPVAPLEIGASGHLARVDPVDAMRVDRVLAWTGGIDASFTEVAPELDGTISLTSEFIVARANERGGATYDRTRQGFYFQAAFAPTEVDARWLRRLEGVVRYDFVDRAGLAAEGPPRVERFTTGAAYWLQASLVVKLAWELALIEPPEMDASDEKRVLAQVAAGF
jgi:hypothetical protein